MSLSHNVKVIYSGAGAASAQCVPTCVAWEGTPNGNEVSSGQRKHTLSTIDPLTSGC